MDDTETERLLRRAGYDIRRDNSADSDANGIYALRDGERHTRSHPTLVALAQYLGLVERPVEFVEDHDALEAVIAQHAQEPNHFVVQRTACRVACFRRHKYVQLVSAGYATAMYELRTDGLRRTSKSNLPPEVMAAFARPAN